VGRGSRGLRVFQFVAFSYFFSQGILAVVVPLYTRGLGFSLSEIGGVMGSFWVGTALVKVFAGRHSDLVGRRPYLAGTLALAAVLKLLYLVVRQPVPFLVLMAAEGLARGLYSATRSPLITELTPAERRGSAFGLIGAVSVAGSSLGNLSAGRMLADAHLSWLFVSMAALLGVTAVAVYFWLPDVTASGIPLKLRELLSIPRPIYRLAIVDFLQNFATAPWFALVIPFYITESLGRPAMALGTLFFVGSLLGAGWGTAGGLLSDRWNPAFLFTLVSALAVAACFAQLCFSTFLPFVVLYLVLSSFLSMSYPALEVVDAAFVRQQARGFDFGVISLAVSLGAFLGNLVVGYALEHFGPAAGYVLVGTALALVVCAFAPSFLRWRPAKGADVLRARGGVLQ